MDPVLILYDSSVTFIYVTGESRMKLWVPEIKALIPVALRDGCAVVHIKRMVGNDPWTYILIKEGE